MTENNGERGTHPDVPTEVFPQVQASSPGTTAARHGPAAAGTSDTGAPQTQLVPPPRPGLDWVETPVQRHDDTMPFAGPAPDGYPAAGGGAPWHPEQSRITDPMGWSGRDGARDDRSALVTRGWPRAAALLVALLAVAGLWVTWQVLVGSPTGQELDNAAVTGAAHGQGTLWQVAQPVLDIVSVGFLVIALGAAMVIALIRRRWGLAVQVAVLTAGANITTQILKYSILQRPDLGTGASTNTMPSGHTTVAAAASVTLFMVVPRRMRPLVAVVGAGYTAATGVSTLVGQWHRPSDVIAAVFVVLAWTGVVCAMTPRSGLDPARGGALAETTIAVVLLALLAVAGAAGGYFTLVGVDLPLVGRVAAADADVRAYVGMAAMVISATAASFAVALLTRQATARGRRAARDY